MRVKDTFFYLIDNYTSNMNLDSFQIFLIHHFYLKCSNYIFFSLANFQILFKKHKIVCILLKILLIRKSILKKL